MTWMNLLLRGHSSSSINMNENTILFSIRIIVTINNHHKYEQDNDDVLNKTTRIFEEKFRYWPTSGFSQYFSWIAPSVVESGQFEQQFSDFGNWIIDWCNILVTELFIKNQSIDYDEQNILFEFFSKNHLLLGANIIITNYFFLLYTSKEINILKLIESFIHWILMKMIEAINQFKIDWMKQTRAFSFKHFFLHKMSTFKTFLLLLLLHNNYNYDDNARLIIINILMKWKLGEEKKNSSNFAHNPLRLNINKLVCWVWPTNNNKKLKDFQICIEDETSM